MTVSLSIHPDSSLLDDAGAAVNKSFWLASVCYKVHDPMGEIQRTLETYGVVLKGMSLAYFTPLGCLLKFKRF